MKNELQDYVNSFIKNNNLKMSKKLIKNGSQGEDVSKIQKKLGLNPDGIFGDDMEKEVKKWQLQNGLKNDGIVGDNTWNKMFETTNSEFKLEKLKGVIPDSVISQIPDTAKKFNITNVYRLSHFLSQCDHESGGFKIVKENLNYSSSGLIKIFSKYFPGNLSELYAHQPEKIGSRVYANRLGNGDEKSGEGFKYRGRGFIQLTGKDNYKKFSNFIGEDCVINPDLISDKYPLSSAAFFFNANGLWSICDKGNNDDVVIAVTKRVNGGTNGLSYRLSYFKKYYNLLS